MIRFTTGFLTSTSGASRIHRPTPGCRRAGRHALATAVTVLALGTALAAAGAMPARAAVDPIGAHSMLQLDDPPSFMEAMFAQAAAMHAASIRLDVAPALIFPSSSQPPDFSGLDDVVALAQTYHLQVVADLFTVPEWMAQCASPTSTPSRCATDDLSAYSSVITQIVRRADPVIRDWEIWNEPDTEEFFDGSRQQYAAMLRTAHDAITSVDPADEVLLGGISGVAGEAWLAQVLATPGVDAGHAFDIANLHERGDLWQLAGDVEGFRAFLAAHGFAGPLWVTEHGYPSDPAYQYDPGYTGGEAAQAAYLAASIPTLIDAGAAEVFVTERDNLSGPFASEGVLGGTVADPPPADPEIIAKPAVAVVRVTADCFSLLGRDCPGAPATASPPALTLPPVPPGQASTRSVTITNPGATPIVFGSASVSRGSGAGLSVAGNTCAGTVLEPRETCSVSARFAPAGAGDAEGTLELSSDDGTVAVALVASAPSLSGLLSASLRHPRFTSVRAGDGVGYPQRWRLALISPFGAAASIDQVTLSGGDAGRFRITADGCDGATLRPYGGCRLAVTFTPARPGTARAMLTVSGTGAPLVAHLRATAFALPAVRSLVVAGRHGCVVRLGSMVSAVVSQAATVRWRLARAPSARPAGCPHAPAHTGHTVATGSARTHPIRRGDAARWSLPAATGRLAPGGYVLTVSATNAHGTGAARALGLRVGPEAASAIWR